MTALDVIDLVGGPEARGREHGRRLRTHIHDCIDIYRLVLGRPDASLLQAAAGIRSAVQSFDPELGAEIEAIAVGARVDPAWIYVLNARSELMAGATDGCTAVFAPESGLLGQTWDWIEAIEPLLFIARISELGGTRIATLTEPGMVAKIGGNDAGLGVCLNFLHAPGPHLGVPVHVLLRSILACRSLGAARRVLDRAGAGRAGNVLVGDRAGTGINVEYLGDHAVVQQLGGVPFVHTNHVDGHPGSGGALLQNSLARAATARVLAPTIGDVGTMADVLDDRSDPSHPICAPYQLFQGVSVGTAATVIMDLDRCRIHARRGPDPGAPFQVVDI